MRIGSALKKALQRFADADNRKVTNYVETVLQEHVTEREKREAKRK